MAIEKKISGDSLELMLSERIDGTVANELEVAVLAAIKEGYKAIYVNLAQATFLCSAGIRVPPGSRSSPARWTNSGGSSPRPARRSAAVPTRAPNCWWMAG